MARDYKERTGLRSGDGEMIHIGDRINKEGAYVSVPVETLENVRKLIKEYYGGSASCFVVSAIDYELFPEEDLGQCRCGKCEKELLVKKNAVNKNKEGSRYGREKVNKTEGDKRTSTYKS